MSAPPENLAPASLPAEIAALLAERGPPVVRVAEVTGRPWKCSKAAFRVWFADGRLAKARLFYDEGWAARVEAILAWLGPDPALAQMLGRRGRASLEEWIEGESLGSDPPPEHRARQAGELLARWHALDTAGLPYDMAEPGAGPILGRLDGWLGTLRDAGVLSAGECRDLVRWAERRLPAAVRVGITHRDFCGGNLVAHATRGLVSIDHEWMAVGPTGLDLARTLERWALDGAARTAFLGGYRGAAGSAELEELEFWGLVAEAFAGQLRLTRTDHDIGPLVASLRARIVGPRAANRPHRLG